MRPSRSQKIEDFKKIVWDFYHKEGRHDLPWRKTKNPYKIIVSEIMLQQTQVARVVEKYSLFLKTFPTISALADAPLAQVLMVWQGMGYNRRALALHRLAKEIITSRKGKIPHTRTELEALTGIGPYTAGAIRAFAFNEPEVFIETNIRRVFIHHFFPRTLSVSDKEIFPLVQKTLEHKNPREWYFALMDYGTHLSKVTKNPNTKSAHYVKQKKFEGSHRQLRGRVLKFLNTKGKCTLASCARALEIEQKKLSVALSELTREGFIEHHGKNYFIKNS
jgi:A/G-specific adenine glycosylase